MTKDTDWRGKSFERNFLSAIAELDKMGDALMAIGLSGCHEMAMLRDKVIRHGAETARIMERDEIEEAPL